MLLRPKKVEAVVIACCTLHNLMHVRYPALQNAQIDQNDPITHQLQAGSWRDEVAEPLQHLTRLQASRVRTKAAELRTYLMNYVNNEGAVAWLNDMI